jgi:hypothetical protein
MASDKMRAAVSFAKILVALGIGYAIYYIWGTTRDASLDDAFVPRFFDLQPAPYLAGIIAAIMVFVLLSRLNKGSGD